LSECGAGSRRCPLQRLAASRFPVGCAFPWEASHEVALCLGVSRRPLVSPHWFSDPSSAFAQCRPVDRRRWPSRFFQQTPGHRMRIAPGTSAHVVTSSSESDRLTAAANVCMRRGASHEVCGSSSTIHLQSPLNPGLPHPVRSAFRVSHPPDGLLLYRLPGLVSCRSAHGVPSPSELFPRPEPWRLSTPHCPLAVRPLPTAAPPPGGSAAAPLPIVQGSRRDLAKSRRDHPPPTAAWS
jgi:hypothetical protein